MRAKATDAFHMSSLELVSKETAPRQHTANGCPVWAYFFMTGFETRIF
jgi:hypothetical protein